MDDHTRADDEIAYLRKQLAAHRRFVEEVGAGIREAENRYYRVHGDDNLAEVFLSIDAALTRLKKEVG